MLRAQAPACLGHVEQDWAALAACPRPWMLTTQELASLANVEQDWAAPAACRPWLLGVQEPASLAHDGYIRAVPAQLCLAWQLPQSQRWLPSAVVFLQASQSQQADH